MGKIKEMSFDHKVTYNHLTSMYEKEAGKVMQALGVSVHDMRELLPKLAVLIQNKSIAEKAVDNMTPDQMANIWENK